MTNKLNIVVKYCMLCLVFLYFSSFSFSNQDTNSKKIKPLKSRNFSQKKESFELFKDPSRIYLEHGSIWVTDNFADMVPELVVSTQQDIIINNGNLPNNINFNIKTNYSYYIDKYELSIYDAKEGILSKPLKLIKGSNITSDISIEWKGDIDSFKKFQDGDQLIYKLKVYDRNNNADSTTTGIINLSSHDIIPNFNQLTSNDYMEKRNFNSANLLVHNIPLNFGMIKIAGTNLVDIDKIYIRDEEYSIEENKFSVIEFLPTGEYNIPIKLVYNDKREEEYILVASLPKRYSITTGIIDLLIGTNYISGNRDTLGDSNTYKNASLYNEAKIALYNKTKFSDKFRITTQIKTETTEYDKLFDNLNERDNKTIFDRVEDFSEIYYPTYGDESYIYRDVDTQSRFYLKAEYSKSDLLWGNYNTGLTGTKFMQYNRSFYGGKGRYRTEKTTKFGDDKVSLTGFVSTVNSLYSHEEFLGTGGSLYFLKHGDVVLGSEKVSIKVVDKNTNLTKSLTTLQEGRDYQFNSFQGRIILNKPLNTFARDANSNGIIKNNPGGDLYSYLVIDYEYLPSGSESYKDSTYGLRGNLWLNDHIGLGLTNLKDNQSIDTYEMKGGILTIRGTENSYIITEVSETKGSTSAGNYLSYDGGISFNKIQNSSDNKKGNAYNVIGNINLSDISSSFFSSNGDNLTGWYQEKDSEYSFASTDNDKYYKTYGGELSLKLTTDLNFKTSYNNHVAKDYSGNKTTELQEGALELEYALTNKIVTKAALKDIKELKNGKVGNATLVGSKIDYELSKSSSIFIEGQKELKKDSNYESNSSVTLGVSTQVTNNLNLDAKTTTGDRGNYHEIGTSYKLSNNQDIYLGYMFDGYESDLNRITAGQKIKINDKLDVFQENQFAKDKGGKGDIGSYGFEYEFEKDYRIGAAFQHGTVELPDENEKNKRIGFSIFSRVDTDNISARNKFEYRQDDGNKDIKQYLTTNNIKYVINNEYTFFSKINYSLTTSDSEDNATFAQTSLGLAYRPIYSDRLNFLSRYTLVIDRDNGSLGHFNNTSDSARNRDYKNIEAHIFEYETVYAHTPKWIYSLKQSYRYDDRDYLRDDNSVYTVKSNTYLLGLRATYKLPKEWEVFSEYHWLFEKNDNDLSQGAIIGVNKYISQYLKMGGGYNFSGFTDDLRTDDYDSHGWFFSITGSF